MDNDWERVLFIDISNEEAQIRKSEDKWNENEMKRDSLKAKALNALVCALTSNKFNRVYNCQTVNFWNTLEVTHDGTNQVKESKISLLTHQYELFEMEKDRTIKDMFPDPLMCYA